MLSLLTFLWLKGLSQKRLDSLRASWDHFQELFGASLRGREDLPIRQITLRTLTSPGRWPVKVQSCCQPPADVLQSNVGLQRWRSPPAPRAWASKMAGVEGLYIIAGKKARMPITVHAVPYIGTEVGSLVSAITGLSLTDVASLELPHPNHCFSTGWDTDCDISIV